MKIVVIGGADLIGSELVDRLQRDGHEPLAASPHSGVNALDEEGLADVLEGAQVVVDVSNVPGWYSATALDFFQTSSRNLLAAESAARVAHHVALSFVGTDRILESGYFRAKAAQEELVKRGPVPYTILRTTPLFEFFSHAADSGTDGNAVRLPSVFVHPVAADDVAGTLADVALGSPLNDTVELAGPEAFRLDELARLVRRAREDQHDVTTDLHARYLGAALDDQSFAPSDDARIASTRLNDWLSRRSS
jgi:uncharacterized protein YbjT (DUF2867 family)